MSHNASNCLKFCIADWPPYTIFLTWSPPYKVAGSTVDVVNIIAEKLGICYTVVRASDNDWGSALPNGSWSGTLGMLNRGVCSECRRRWKTYHKGYSDGRRNRRQTSVSSVYIDELTMSYLRPVLESDMAGFVKPFTSAMWGVLLAAIILVCVALSCLQNAQDALRPSAEREPTATPSVWENMKSSTFWVFSILLAQSHSWKMSARFVAGVWLLMVFVVATVYRSNLMAMLISPKVKLPFDSLEELADTDITVWAPTGSLFHDAMNEAAPDTPLARIGKQVYLSNFSPNVMLGYFAEKWGLTSMRGTLIYYLDLGFSRYGYCKHYVMSKGFFRTTSLSLAFPKNSTLKPKVDKIILRLRESGIIEHLFRSRVSNATECLKPVGVENNIERPLELGDFYGVFIVYVFGITLASLSFLLEFAAARGRTTKPN
ncbi:glutamate receptor ionotropic, delta-2-like [Penaeus japonicus]|uniref:glutamate receptor ionotropic, delta-2-like n=1 Tax=Penaeus japonicus TaxID=27405 RepID=UPI001C70DC31|nr:glutamate receptor ionotropic, delta-2-like [Penaeus japonicus]